MKAVSCWERDLLERVCNKEEQLRSLNTWRHIQSSLDVCKMRRREGIGKRGGACTNGGRIQWWSQITVPSNWIRMRVVRRYQHIISKLVSSGGWIGPKKHRDSSLATFALPTSAYLERWHCTSSMMPPADSCPNCLRRSFAHAFTTRTNRPITIRMRTTMMDQVAVSIVMP